MPMHKHDFHFDLPPELIASYPAAQRSQSRLLHLDCKKGKISHYRFDDLADLLCAQDLLVFNNTQVIPARLFGQKDSGGRLEILIERVLDATTVLAQVKSSKPLRAGGKILLDSCDYQLQVDGRQDGFYRLNFPAPGAFEILDQVGRIPLPPYIGREDDASDRERYQTVYAARKGAVAAPTAGLHFDQALLKKIEAKAIAQAQVTLHVGAGTFQPLRVDVLEDHKMHSEWFEIDENAANKVNACKQSAGRVVAVGTTSVRVLESAAREGVVYPVQGETDIFIYPGVEFQMVDALVTNFHLPESTLIMLVSAFAGVEQVMAAYRVAIEEGYRFFSYGDAMLVTR